VAAALLSSASDIPVPADMVVFGENRPVREVRAVGQAEARLKEAAKLGFAKALAPAVHRTGSKAKAENGLIAAQRIGHVQDLTALFRQSNNSGQKR